MQHYVEQNINLAGRNFSSETAKAKRKAAKPLQLSEDKMVKCEFHTSQKYSSGLKREAYTGRRRWGICPQSVPFKMWLQEDLQTDGKLRRLELKMQKDIPMNKSRNKSIIVSSNSQENHKPCLVIYIKVVIAWTSSHLAERKYNRMLKVERIKRHTPSSQQ